MIELLPKPPRLSFVNQSLLLRFMIRSLTALDVFIIQHQEETVKQLRVPKRD